MLTEIGTDFERQMSVVNGDDDNNNSNNNNNNNNKPPENGANKPDVIVHGKQTNIWTLFEGIVCQVGEIAERFKEKQTKYIELHAGIKREYKSTSIYQINIVFDFLGGHHEQLRND